MKYKEGDYEASHEDPVWRGRANFIIAAHLGVNGSRNEWEQLWAEKVGPDRYILCCIPFFAYDIALGDEVKTDEESTIMEVTNRSGQVTFRVWFRGESTSSRQAVLKEVEKFGALIEWSSDNLLAISVSEVDAQGVADFLHFEELEGGLQYETGRRLAN